MTKRQTSNKQPAAQPIPALIAGLEPAHFDGLRDGFLATISWPAETPDAVKAMVVTEVNGFIAYVCGHAADAGLMAEAAAADEKPKLAEGSLEIIVTGPRDGRYRCGRYFTDVASPPFFATPAELERLAADPRLVISRTGNTAGD